MSSHGANAYTKWYVRDFRSSRKVQRMGYLARGFYRELLDEEFLEGSIPNDVAALADICGCPLKVMEKAWPEISPCFQEIDGRLFNTKLESLRTEQDKIRVKRAEAGRLGGIAKQTAANAKQLPEGAKHTESASQQMPYSRAEQKQSRALAEGTDEEGLEPSMVTSAVMDDLHLSGRELRIVLDEVCNREMHAGMAGRDLRTALGDAWRDYEVSKPKLSYTVGAEKFFGQIWRNKAGWPWKEGEAPAPRKAEPAVAADAALADLRSTRVIDFRQGMGRVQ
jgi:uncharacterized protein YdaU (DUF1376 family)